MEKIEIELKFILNNVGDLKERLDKNALFLNENFKKDTYFIPYHRNFVEQKPIYEWLRIRESNRNNKTISILNYKNFGKDRKVDTVACKEFETEISDSETLRKIFKI
jgi:predicted adenylyl cyclase CyaB